MFVSEIMSTCVAECTEDTRLEDVFGLIHKCDCGMVVVVDSLAHGVPIGVVTERSICEQLISRGINPRSLSAVSVMDSRIKKILSTESVESIAGTDHSNVAAIVAVDEDRRICGLVSKEKLKRTAVTVVKKTYEPVQAASADVLQTRPQRISEIPAFGWMS